MTTEQIAGRLKAALRLAKNDATIETWAADPSLPAHTQEYWKKDSRWYIERESDELATAQLRTLGRLTIVIPENRALLELPDGLTVWFSTSWGWGVCRGEND